jgi:hypothetical protein
MSRQALTNLAASSKAKKHLRPTHPPVAKAITRSGSAMPLAIADALQLLGWMAAQEQRAGSMNECLWP